MVEAKKIPDSLIKDARQRFGLGEKFIRTYLSDRGAGLDFSDVKDWSRLGEKYPSTKLYFNFALSTVTRGRSVCEYLRPHFPPGAKRYLDVGCAYGGFLTAFAQDGFEVTGIEADPEWARMGRQNTEELGLKNSVLEDDFLTCDLESLGRFHVITCNDVIEHILDPQLALARMVQLLEPGGILFLEIPNFECITDVTSDGHFQVFGITLLERYAAREYLDRVKPGVRYGVGEYFELDWYLGILRRLGLSASVDDTRHRVGQLADVPVMIKTLLESYVDWQATDAVKLEPFLQMQMKRRFYKYGERLFRDYNRALFEGQHEQFERRYLSSFWNLIGKRPG